MISSPSCSRIYFLILASFKPAVPTSYPTLRNLRLPYRYFRREHSSTIIRELLPLIYPVTDDSACFGGIMTGICTWSIILYPSIISLPLQRQKLSYDFSCLLTVLPVNHVSPVLRGEDHMVPARPFRMRQMLFFRHKKKHLFDGDGSLDNSVLSKRCFFRYNRFGLHPLSGCFSVSVASAPSTA